jgi:hypothetical protein
LPKQEPGSTGKADLTGLSPSRIQQFFTRLDGNYQVNKTIRDMCVFAHHNLLKDAPFSRLDLVDLPECADLSRTCLTKTGADHFSLRAERTWLFNAGQIRKRWQ